MDLPTGLASHPDTGEEHPVTGDWRVTVTIGGDLSPDDAAELGGLIDSYVTVVEGRPAGERTDVTIASDAADLLAAVRDGLTKVEHGLAAADLAAPIMGVRARTAEEYEREAADRPDLVGAVEVGKILGVSRARVHQLAERSDFPEPLYELAAGKLWDRRAIERFRKGWKRAAGRPRKASKS